MRSDFECITARRIYLRTILTQEMVAVPESIRKLFDLFPLVLHPVVPNTSVAQKRALENRKFYFEDVVGDKTEEEFFTLGVHNVVQLKNTGNRFIPTDPLSFASCLILCRKNGLRLPRASEAGRNLSKSSMIKLDYFASPDNQLPLLIEDNNKDDTREIRIYNSIKESIKKNSKLAKNGLVFMINEMIDIDMADLWTMCLLQDIPSNSPLLFKEIFGLHHKKEESCLANQLAVVRLVQETPNWHQFHARYGYLFHTLMTKKVVSFKNRFFDKNLLEHLAFWDIQALAHLYNSKLRSFEEKLELLIDFFSKREVDEQNAVIELKVVAFLIICASLLVPENKLHQLVTQPKYAAYMDKCYKILDAF